MTDAALATVATTTLDAADAALPRGDADRAPWRRRVRRAVLLVLALLLCCALWQGYKAVGSADGTSVFGVRILPRTDDASMPSLWSIAQRFGRPEVDVSGSRSVGLAVLDGAWFTFRVAMAGCAVGVLVGMLLAVMMQRFRVAERGLLPYVVLSQTVPLVALAPLVVGWGGVLHLGSLTWQPWMSVAVISAYLAFFPVAVGGLRGLQSPSPAAVELMRAGAASWWQTLVKLRLPAAVPHLVPALRLAASSAVVGAIVAEISTGTGGGIGRLIIAYSQDATGDPPKVYTAIVGAAALGLAVAGLVALLDVALMRNRPPAGAR